jgi:hypothetical protein
MRIGFYAALIAGIALAAALGTAQQPERRVANRSAPVDKPVVSEDAVKVLPPQQWRRVDRAVERALAWLAEQQLDDGSFPTDSTGQPGVTCLCIMAFLAHGHLPGEGPYGTCLERATDFAVNCQKPNGLVALIGPDGRQISRLIPHQFGSSAAYNHAISSLTLSELYGVAGAKEAPRMKSAITRAIAATLVMQRWPKERPEDRGGWRYIDHYERQDSDLSITGWSLMFLRSARNAGFNVPEDSIDDAVAYVRRTYSREHHAFGYMADVGDHRSRAMAGAGILALAHAGFHNAPESAHSGEWILQHNFDRYNVIYPFTQEWSNDRYHYGLLNCCQGMYQLGGKYWEEFFPAHCAHGACQSTGGRVVGGRKSLLRRQVRERLQYCTGGYLARSA